MSHVILLASLATLAIASGSIAQRNISDQLQAKIWKSETGELPYREFSPKKGKERYSLVLFLHGAGERGKDNRRQLAHGVPDFVSDSNQKERPCFLLAPQCPRGVWWADDKVYPLVLQLLKAKIDDPRVDPDRVYITGLSMGGYGTWHAIARDTELFAAAVPICGGGTTETAKLLGNSRLARLPVWVFHGTADPTVKIQKSKIMIAALAKAGNTPKFTSYEGVGHNSWSRAYSDRQMHEWMFAQRRSAATRTLRDGDRVVFFGDSITAAGARKNGYIRIMEAELAKRKPKLDVKFIGAGISGHKVPDLQRRIERDVLAKKPTVVFIYIGINDVWHWGSNRGTKKKDFESGLRELIAKITKVGADVILCTPSVIGEKTDGSNKFDKMLAEYSAISRSVAAETGTQMLDLRPHFKDHHNAHTEKNQPKGILTGDTVHLNRAGNRFVADRMLEALGVEPAKR